MPIEFNQTVQKDPLGYNDFIEIMIRRGSAKRQVRGRGMNAHLNSTVAIFRMTSDPRGWGPKTGEIPDTRSLGRTSRIPEGGDSVR